MKDMLPIHPMTALLLKNIATAFKSNQRSMFDFIKMQNTEDVKAFQWFIENTGPLDNHPLLTVNMLWSFFYEKGRENLTPDIRLVLDVFPQQHDLREDERIVLKAILIMQALDQRLSGSIDLMKATEQNLSYIFEGISDLEGVACINIAKQLVKKGVLVLRPLSNGKQIFAAAVLAGDQTKIDAHKKTIRQSCSTSKLVTEGKLSNILSLSPALRLRVESEPGTGAITPVTISDFTRTINSIRNRPKNWHFNVVLAFAKDEAEATDFRKTIKAAVADEQYENIIFIDSLDTPLGNDLFEQYVDHSALAMYYNGNNTKAAHESGEKAKRVLDSDWKNRLYQGQFLVYTHKIQQGEKFSNGEGVASKLQALVIERFGSLFDFSKGLTENQFKLTTSKAAAKCGIIQNTSGVMVGVEKQILQDVWMTERYWENTHTSRLPISKIKMEIDKLIEAKFVSDFQISFGVIYDFLEDKYGFAPCNLSAFLTGFLLKEYGKEPYRYSDSYGSHEVMTQDKLAEMIGNYIGKQAKPTFIVKMTAKERAFYELAEIAWGISPNTCSAVGQISSAITSKMRGLGFPVWCLKEMDQTGVYDVVQRFIELVQLEGQDAHNKAVELGSISIIKKSLSYSLKDLITVENCQKGMRKFLESFEKGTILELAKGIGASDKVLSDVKALFSVKHSSLWDRKTGEDEIRKLIVDYGIVLESNNILNTASRSISESFKDWHEKLKFLGISCEALGVKYPLLDKLFEVLVKVYRKSDVLPEQLSYFLSELKARNMEIRHILENENLIFAEIYSPYLTDLDDSDISSVKSTVSVGMFELTKTQSNAKVKIAAEEYRKNLLKTKMYSLWKNKTGTKNPREWSNQYKTPILSCVPENEFDNAKKAFDTLNKGYASDLEINNSLAFLETTSIYEVLSDENKRNAAFENDFVKEYRSLLTDIDKVRNELDRISIDAYDWRENPAVKTKIKKLAEAEYNAGGSDKALEKIEKMDDSQLKTYLKRLVLENMNFGIEIISSGAE